MVITKKIILLLALLISEGECPDLLFWHTRFPMCRLKLVLNIIFMLNWHGKGSSVQVWFDIYHVDLNTNVGEHSLFANIFLMSFITLILVISYHFYLNTKTSLI